LVTTLVTIPTNVIVRIKTSLTREQIAVFSERLSTTRYDDAISRRTAKRVDIAFIVLLKRILDLHEALDAPVILESRERRSANERRWAAAGETIAKSRLVVRGTVVDARIALETASLQKRIVRPYAVTTVTMTGNWRSVGETAWRNHQWDHTAADSSALLQLRLDQDDIAKIQKRARDAMDDHEKQTVYKFVLLLLSCGRHKFPSVCYGAIQETCDCKQAVSPLHNLVCPQKQPVRQLILANLSAKYPSRDVSVWVQAAVNLSGRWPKIMLGLSEERLPDCLRCIQQLGPTILSYTASVCTS